MSKKDNPTVYVSPEGSQIIELALLTAPGTLNEFCNGENIDRMALWRVRNWRKGRLSLITKICNALGIDVNQVLDMGSAALGPEVATRGMVSAKVTELADLLAKLPMADHTTFIARLTSRYNLRLMQTGRELTLTEDSLTLPEWDKLKRDIMTRDIEG